MKTPLPLLLALGCVTLFAADAPPSSTAPTTPAPAAAPEKQSAPRVWTSTDGLRINAVYLRQDSTAATVAISGKNSLSKIPLSRLSSDDIAWLAKQPPPPPDLLKVAARLHGRVVSVTPDGVLLQAAAAVTAVYGPGAGGGGVSSTGMSLSSGPLPKTYVYNSDDNSGRPKHQAGLVYLRNYPIDGVADNDFVDVDAWPDGVFEYKSAAGARTTVHAWHVYNAIFASGIPVPIPATPKPAPKPAPPKSVMGQPSHL